MTTWFLQHFHGILDWLIVWGTVFAFVFTCQWLINFLKGPEIDNQDDHQT